MEETSSALSCLWTLVIVSSCVRQVETHVHIGYGVMLLSHVLLGGLCLSVAYAIEMPVYIATPSQVTAGTSFEANLDADLL
jgi:hypothetical protein